MKIVQVGAYPLDSALIKGGIEASVYGLSQELSKNHKVIVIDSPNREYACDTVQKDGKIEVFRFRNRGKNNIGAIFRIPSVLKVIKKISPDICHLHGTSLYTLFLYISLKFHRIPTFITVHGLKHIEQYKLWKQNKNFRSLIKYMSLSMAEFLLLSMCKKVVVDTKYVADQINNYQRNYKIWRKPECFVIPQGINPDYFSIPDNYIQNRLLSVGAFVERKGHLWLLEVIHKLIQHNPLITLDIAGALVDKNYYNLLQFKIKELSLEANVKIHANLSQEKIKKLYEKAHIFVLHSEEESQGIVFCEAMACGKPIVATNVGGIPYVVIGGFGGLLSDFSDDEKFYLNIEKILEQEEIRKKFSEFNREHSTKYSWETISNNIVDLYTGLIKK